MVKQRHQFFVVMLAATDALVVALACYGAWALRRLWGDGGVWPDTWQAWVKEPLVLAAVPITILCMMGLGVYRPRRDRSAWIDVREVMRATLVAGAGLAVMLWAMGGSSALVFGSERPVRVLGGEIDAGRFQLALLVVMQCVLLGLHRLIFRATLREVRRRGHNLRHVAVIGTGRLGRIACRTLERNTWTGIHVAYFVSHREESTRAACVGKPVLGGLARLEDILGENKPDAVYVAMPNALSSLVPGLLRRLERFAVDVRIIPDVHPRYLPQSMVVSELDGMPILSYRENPHHGLGGLTKRGLDVAGAALGILVFLPLMLAIAALVRLSSPGPVIFRQRRVSLGGEVFNIFKFRTMFHAEDEQTASWTTRDDPRVTPVGRWLRRVSLDELPQLLNVLRGEMSLVGPRPERPELIERFREDWRGYVLRQHVKAGITGWAQVNGLRGDTSLKKRLQHDLFYIRHWSLGLDLKILWLTLFRGFVHRNAH